MSCLPDHSCRRDQLPDGSPCTILLPLVDCPQHCIDGQCLPPAWVGNGQTYPDDDPNLRLYFTFDHDDAVGDTGGVKDDSANNNHGTLSSWSYVQDGDKQFVALDGSARIVAPTSSSLKSTDGLTLEAMIRPNRLPAACAAGRHEFNNWG